jgi:hypothetical protein
LREQHRENQLPSLNFSGGGIHSEVKSQLFCSQVGKKATLPIMSARVQQPQVDYEYVEETEYAEETEYVEETEYDDDEVIDEITEEEDAEYFEEEEYYEESEGGGMAAMIAAAASKRQNRLDQGDVQMTGQQQNNAYCEDGEEDDAPQGGMADMIAAAAKQRKNRLDKGGEKKVTHVEKAPNDGLDMTAMIAKKANARNARIEAGGEVKVREIPKEHKNTFVDIALEAARVGTLTRLNEHTVVAVAEKKDEKVWGGPSGLRTDHIRSAFFMAVNEAAALGTMRMQKPIEVTNYDQNAYYEEVEPEDVDKMTDEDGRRVVRQLYLIDRRIEEERIWKKEEWSAENAAKIVKYESMDDVALPSATAPKWKPKKTERSHREMMDAISHGVAERAWERNYRLGRPKANLQMTRSCRCKFCVNPNPYQTHKYKEMEEKKVEKSEAPVKSAPVLEKEEEPKKTTTKAWENHVKRSRNIAPGEYSETSSFTPVPTAIPPKPKFKASRPPTRPIVESVPEPVHEVGHGYEGGGYDGGEPKVTVLLDETTTWGHKREKTPKPKKEKEKKKKSKKQPKKTQSKEGCLIM